MAEVKIGIIGLGFMGSTHWRIYKAMKVYQKNENYVFESAVLERDCEIANDQINAVVDDLLTLKLIWKQEHTINGESRVLYYSRPSHKLLAVLLMTREIGYKGAYSLQSHIRNTPFIKE